VAIEPDNEPLSGARIILVGEEPTGATLDDALEAAGAFVWRVGDTHDALDALGRRRFDVVVGDLAMPRGEGLELCLAIRVQSELSGVHVLLLAGQDQGTELEEALSAGADDVLARPFDSAELLARVASGLRLVRLRRKVVSLDRTLEQLAVTDPLTGLPNRRAFDDLLAAEVARVHGGAAPVCVALVDVDDLARLNRSGGQEAGDRALRAVAAILASQTRDVDVASRIGPDEFALLLNNCTPHLAAHACVRIAEAVRAAGLTVSFGIAQLLPGTAAEETFLAAAVALEEAKGHGGDWVALAA